jgi:hypothetical protein
LTPWVDEQQKKIDENFVIMPPSNKKELIVI